MNNITLVTGLWDIKRESLTEGWSRSFDHYKEKFAQLLKVENNLIIFGEPELESFVWEHRKKENTQFIIRKLFIKRFLCFCKPKNGAILIIIFTPVGIIRF